MVEKLRCLEMIECADSGLPMTRQRAETLDRYTSCRNGTISMVSARGRRLAPHMWTSGTHSECTLSDSQVQTTTTTHVDNQWNFDLRRSSEAMKHDNELCLLTREDTLLRLSADSVSGDVSNNASVASVDYFPDGIRHGTKRNTLNQSLRHCWCLAESDDYVFGEYDYLCHVF